MVKGVVAKRLVTIPGVQWLGSTVVEVTHEDATVSSGQAIVHCDREPLMEIVTQAAKLAFDGDGTSFRLASEPLEPRLPL